MDCIPSIDDIKRTFFIVYFKNKSNVHLLLSLRDRQLRNKHDGIHSDEGKIDIIETKPYENYIAIAGKEHETHCYVLPKTDFYLLFDLSKKIQHFL